MTKLRFYGVVHGRELGVFRTYAECEARVTGFANAIFRGFKTEEEAAEFVAHVIKARTVGQGAAKPAPPIAAPLSPLAAALATIPHVPISAAASAKPTRSPTGITALAKAMRASTSAIAAKTVSTKQAKLPTAPKAMPTMSRPAAMPATPKGCIDIYVDGACHNNGQPSARGGFGGFYGDGDPRNFSLPLVAGERQTNNRGELRAIEYAIRQELATATQSGRFDALRIHTDSMYSILCITKYLDTWKRNGFANAKKKPIENKDVILSINRLMRDYSQHKKVADGESVAAAGVQLFHVKGHSKIYGNEMADRLAGMGAASVGGTQMDPTKPVGQRGKPKKGARVEETECFPITGTPSKTLKRGAVPRSKVSPRKKVPPPAVAQMQDVPAKGGVHKVVTSSVEVV